jgi:hypothetical protein
MKKPIKIVFLDIDGVLNGHTYWDSLVWRIFWRLGLRKLHRKLFRAPYGVHEEKIRRLGKIIEKTGALCVMTSSWRDAYFSEDSNYALSNILELKTLFEKYHIKVIDRTGRDSHGRRQNEILEWLAKHQDEYEYISFCILDDEADYLKIFMDDKLVITTNRPYVKLHWMGRDGLQDKHVRKAIKILNESLIADPLEYYKQEFQKEDITMFSLLSDEEYLPLTKKQIQILLEWSMEDDMFNAEDVMIVRRATRGLTGVF